MILKRDQILAIAREVEEDENIAQVELETTEKGRLRVSTIELRPVKKPLPLNRKRDTSRMVNDLIS